MDGSDSPLQDEGFTLIEVVVAFGLMVLIMVSLLGFFVRSSGTVTSMQRRQAAVGLADQAMEVVRTVLPTVAGTTPNPALSPLVGGRFATSVHTQWTTPAAPAFVISGYLNQMNEASDPAATGASTPVVPLSVPQTVSSQPYTINQYIGLCYRANSPAATCVKANTAGYLPTYRIVIVVTWTPPNGQTCATTPCSFALSSLADFNDDPKFMINGGSTYGAAPTANPDSGTTVNQTTPLSISVKSNDTGTFGQDAVSVLTQPKSGGTQRGTVALKSGFHDGTLVYTPPGGWTGTVTFTYKVTDLATPARTATATPTITVHP